MNDEVKVIFRKLHNGEVIALFPEIASDCSNWYYCQSYMHIGQHGGCDPMGVINSSTLATKNEFAALKDELESIGYKLAVCYRLTYKMNLARRNNWRQMIEA